MMHEYSNMLYIRVLCIYLYFCGMYQLGPSVYFYNYLNIYFVRYTEQDDNITERR